MTFRAKGATTDAGYPWSYDNDYLGDPQNYPDTIAMRWYYQKDGGDWVAFGTSETVSHTFYPAGVYTVKLEVDDTAGRKNDKNPDGTPIVATSTITVYSVNAEVKSVTFTSDHGKLKSDNGTYAYQSGTELVPHGWVENGANNPISHTKGLYVTADVVVCVKPSGIPYRLVGSSANDALNFWEDRTSTGADETVHVLGYNALPSKIDITNNAITWYADRIGPDPVLLRDAGISGPHKMFVTWGDPGPEPTAKRMNWACTQALGATSITEAAGDYKTHVAGIGTPPRVTNQNAWSFLDSGRNGYCNTLAHLCAVGLGMIGIPASDTVSYATADTVATSSTCKAEVRDQVEFLGYDWDCRVVYPAPGGSFYNFEGFFTVQDPGVKAYTVFDPWGPSQTQDYYYLEVMRSGTNDQYWVIDGDQTQGGLTFFDGEELPVDHWAPPVVP